MKLISYKATAEMPKGLIDILIRFRLKGIYSHTELLFEPGDNVEKYVPDNNLEPIDGKYWCGSSSAFDRLPQWSIDRAGKIGGVRWKRIDPMSGKWDQLCLNKKTVVCKETNQERDLFDKELAAAWFYNNQGMKYDYRLIGNFITWFVGENTDMAVCSEAVSTSLHFSEAWRYDPVLLHKVLAKIVE